MLKCCSKCIIEKEAAEFSPQRQSKDKLSSWCKACKRQLMKSRRRALGVTPTITPNVVTDVKKECLNCRLVHPLNEFPDSERGRKGKGSYCKKCTREYHRQEKFRLKRRAAVSRYREKHKDRWRFLHRCQQMKRRAWKAAADTGAVTHQFLCQLYLVSTCHYCNKPIPPERRTADHIIPLSKGGLHHPDNMVMSCGSCNSSKSNRSVEEFIKEVS
jgi:5-methylcytosine-specific restriction endonuclease McrA